MVSWHIVASLNRLTCSTHRYNDVGAGFLYNDPSLTSVKLPACVLEIGSDFLSLCTALKHIDLKHTRLQRVGAKFLYDCPATACLPNSVTEVGPDFLGCSYRVKTGTVQLPTES